VAAVEPTRRKRVVHPKAWAALIAVLLHIAVVMFVWRVHSDLILSASRKPGGALRVTLMTAPAKLVAPPPTPQVQPQVKKPVPQPRVMATHHESPRQVAALDPKPQSKVVPVETPPPPTPQPVAAAQPSAPAPQPSIPLPTPGDAGKNAHLTCAIPAPPYPPRARRLGHEGTVDMAVTIDTSGRIVKAQVQKSSGYEELDEAAQQAMLSGRCNPLMLAGRAVSTTATQPLSFRLDN
jgi:protein TonB